MAKKSFDEVDIGEPELMSSYLSQTNLPPLMQPPCMWLLPATSYPFLPLDKSGHLDQKELFIALLKLYDKLNGMLPCRVTVPDLDQVGVGIMG